MAAKVLWGIAWEALQRSVTWLIIWDQAAIIDFDFQRTCSSPATICWRSECAYKCFSFPAAAMRLRLKLISKAAWMFRREVSEYDNPRKIWSTQGWLASFLKQLNVKLGPEPQNGPETESESAHRWIEHFAKRGRNDLCQKCRPREWQQPSRKRRCPKRGRSEGQIHVQRRKNSEFSWQAAVLCAAGVPSRMLPQILRWQSVGFLANLVMASEVRY